MRQILPRNPVSGHAGASHPAWGAGFALLVLITQLSIIVALRWGMLTLTRAASATDELEAAVARSTSRRRVTEHVSAQVAEESRVLHDTAINTLGAIAHGGAGTADTERVRAQCRRDVAFLTGRRGGPLPPMPSSLLDVFQQPGLPIRRLGAPDGELRRWDAALQGSVRDAIVACVRDAVTNATKHSGADHVEVDVRASDVLLTVEVRDSGVGFRAGSTNGFGISRSILGRATQQGFRASVESDPGSGTVVTLEVPAAPPRQVPTNGDESVTVDLLGTRAARLWGLGVALVSITLFCAGSVNEHAALYPMIGLMLCVRALNVGVPGFGSSRVNLVVLAVAPSAVSALAAAATGFGSVSANHWPALAPTGPFVLLLAVTTSVVRRSVAAGAWIVTSLVLAARAGATSAGSAHVVLVAAGVGLAFTGIWVVFQRLLRHLGRQSFEARKELAALDLRAQLDAANQGGVRKWLAAGLDSAIELLDEIAVGVRPVGAAATRDACTAEERYLRQIVQVSPSLVHIGRSVPRMLNFSRARGITYVLHIGEVDAPGPDMADEVEETIVRTLAALDTGAELRASFYPVQGDLRLTLIGASVPFPEQTRAAVETRRLGEIELIEITYRVEDH